jgi:hypothetical protein
MDYIKYRKYKNKYLKLKKIYGAHIYDNSPNLLIKGREDWENSLIQNKKLLESRKDDLICLLNTYTYKCKSDNYLLFLNELMDYHDIVINKLKCKKECNDLFIDQYNKMHTRIINLWENVIFDCLDKFAILKNIPNRNILISNFVDGHINSIEKLGYKLNKSAREVLNEAFTKWFLCDQCPAPFSILSILNEEKKRGCNLIKDADKKDATTVISIAEHCLALANFVYKEDPQFLSKSELDELIVMSLFHDVYYYEDFINHDIHILELFKQYIHSDNIKKIIGVHFDLVPVNESKYIFKSDIDKLTNKWMHMDWYLSLKKPMFPSNNDNLPIETFYHNIGRVMTNL